MRNSVGQRSWKERNVTGTVIEQLAASKNRGSMLPPTDIDEYISYLISKSATDMPPALAACEGLGSSPYRLYKSISFKKLHAFDQVVLRNIMDGTHQFFLRSVTCTLPLIQATKIANQWMTDLPTSTKLRKINLFTVGSDDLMAGVTGKIRRDTCPFLWVFAMVIKNVAPDDDSITQI